MISLELQNVSDSTAVPDKALFEQWLNAALDESFRDRQPEVVIRIVDETEGGELNYQYRGKDGATNVLSFPFSLPSGVTLDFYPLGDLVICAPVVEREAHEQKKPILAHWAHMVIHGLLHLQGYDHIENDAAVIMEVREIAILQQLGYANPYAEDYLA